MAMRRVLLLLISSLVFVACAAAEKEPFVDEKVEFFEMDFSGEKYYFSYPSSAIIVPQGRTAIISYGFCTVNFGPAYDFSLVKDESLEFEEKKEDGRTFVAGYKDGLMVSYAGIMDDLSYGFWLDNHETGVVDCADFIDQLSFSFKNKLDYVNRKYGFSVYLPDDYKLEHLPDDDGVLLKKWVENVGYKASIMVFGSKNIDDYGDLGEFVSMKFDGYSFEFGEYDQISGVFVDENVGDDSTRHFFTMDEGRKNIYEISLKMPSRYYDKHKEEFEKVVASMRIF